MVYFTFILVSLLTSRCVSFMPAPSRGFVRNGIHLFSSPVSADEIESMRAGEIKKELESYGISTRSFLEKKELVEALTKARADGLKPKTSPNRSSPSSSSKSPADDSSSKESNESSSKESNKSREERLEEQMEKCKAMKAGDLKKELEARGISTKSFFEKPEFVKALAEAIVDGIEKGSSVGGDDTEGYAEYANVEVLTDDSSGPKKKKNRDGAQQQESPFGGGGSPFGGGMPGGMPGGMGGIADMLKNMGMGGGAPGGSSPFGGAGGNPFGGAGGGNPFGGDMMGKAQKMMQNPKVMELMAKAQSNPKMMKAMQECMSNPAAFAKYQNDPEISELMKELQKYV